MKHRALTAAALLALLVLGYQAARWLDGLAPATTPGLTRYEPPVPLPDFRLRDQNNQALDLARLRGKWNFIFFGYTHCPDICPTTLGVLRDLHRIAGGKERGVQYVFISVDPERDDPKTLRRYAAYFDAELVAATGAHSELQRLARALGAYYEISGRGGNYEVQHSAAIFLIDPDARLRALFAAPHEATHLAQGLERLRAR